MGTFSTSLFPRLQGEYAYISEPAGALRACTHHILPVPLSERRAVQETMKRMASAMVLAKPLCDNAAPTSPALHSTSPEPRRPSIPLSSRCTTQHTTRQALSGDSGARRSPIAERQAAFCATWGTDRPERRHPPAPRKTLLLLSRHERTPGRLTGRTSYSASAVDIRRARCWQRDASEKQRNETLSNTWRKRGTPKDGCLGEKRAHPQDTHPRARARRAMSWHSRQAPVVGSICPRAISGPRNSPR